jgi:hypothetical protein
MEPSSFNDMTIDKLLTAIHMSETQYTLDTLHIQAPTGIFAFLVREISVQITG